MDRDDAAYACGLIGAPTVIPCHYNTFPPIETDAEAFKAAGRERDLLAGRDPRAGRVARALSPTRRLSPLRASGAGRDVVHSVSLPERSRAQIR